MNDADAKDLTQIVTLILLEGRSVPDGRSGAPGWLLGTLSRQAKRMLRGRRRELPSALPAADLPATVVSPERAALLRERDRALWRVTEGLSSPRARCLVWLLAHHPELSQRELAAELDLAVGSVGPLRRRCLDALRAGLRAAGYDASDLCR